LPLIKTKKRRGGGGKKEKPGGLPANEKRQERKKKNLTIHLRWMEKKEISKYLRGQNPKIQEPPKKGEREKTGLK